MKSVVHAACPHDCPDACGVLITIDDGQAVKIQGDPVHPMTRGFLCAKVTKYLDRVYSPERLLYPMRRRLPKGKENSGPAAFERITWDEALNEIASKLKAVSDEFGPEAILPYSYGGTLGQLNNASMDQRFFHRLGASQLNRTICATAGGDALLTVLGKKMGTEPEQFAKSKYIIAWGANIHGNNVHLWPFIEEARRNGAKLVVIDPYRTRTAKCADWHIAINPGTDVALALCMMRVIIHENLHDADYVSKYTLGFDELRARVMEDAYAPERVSQITGIPVEDIYKLAREYATARPAVIRVNYGVQRSENGGMNVRAITMLPCITGSWKEVGGGLQLSTSGAFPFNKESMQRPDLMMKSPLRRAARVINMSELGKALLTESNSAVKAVFVYNSNPAAVAPNHNDVVRGLMRPDLFTVVHEQFFTDTTDYADIILPATTFFEHKELQGSYGHYYLQVSNQAIAPLGECKSNVDLFRDLALRMRFDEGKDSDACFRETVDEMIDGALNSGHEWMKGITRQRLEAEPQIRLNFTGNEDADAKSEPYLPFASGKFMTASGKAELHSAQLAAQGLDPVASFIAPKESRHSERAREFPLELLGRKADNHLNTTFCNLPSHQKMEEPHLLEMSPVDANARGIRDGDAVRVFNSRGELTLKARVDGAVRAGVVAAKLDWARLNPEGKNINVLTSETLTEIGAGATFYSCLVQVSKTSNA
ncbi:MAG: molybdopterin dinucleotide-binding region [Acidobacteriales bacterium]|nr:molybdopterin dinucleotide-binding region [Terriglobales bacterium]